jgi:predicted Zn-dependent peptidase
VLEEINMNEDDPADVAHEEFARALWSGHVLERPILGTRESITGMPRESIAGYWARRYAPESLVVAAAGNLDHDALVAQIDESFGDWEGADTGHDLVAPEIVTRVRVRRRDTEQAHLVIGGEGIPRDDERRHAASLLNHVLGGGMSSRLFRKVREERGLAYAVYSFRMPHADTGGWGVYVGTTPSQTAEVLQLIRAEAQDMVDNGITEDELARAKGHTKGSLAISLEDANSRMTRLGRAELIGLPHLSTDEQVTRYEAVTRDDIAEIAAEVLGGDLVLGAVGPFSSDDLAEHVA